MQRNYIKWRGHQICISESGAGKPLFLVPGLGCSADMWQPFMDHFPDRRLVSFDAPGTGRSSTPHYPVSVASLAALAIAVLDRCRVPSTDVIGFSYGGAVSQQLAYSYPQRVERLVLAATTCGLGAFPGSAAAMAVMATSLRFHSPRYFEQVAASLYGGMTGRDPAQRRNASGQRRRLPPTPYGYAMQLMGGLNWSSWGFLPDIPHETLVMCGDDDPLVPVANGHLLAGRIPRAELTVVAQAGHLFLWDEPERVAPRIAQFVA